MSGNYADEVSYNTVSTNTVYASERTSALEEVGCSCSEPRLIDKGSHRRWRLDHIPVTVPHGRIVRRVAWLHVDIQYIVWLFRVPRQICFTSALVEEQRIQADSHQRRQRRDCHRDRKVQRYRTSARWRAGWCGDLHVFGCPQPCAFYVVLTYRGKAQSHARDGVLVGGMGFGSFT
jgi:hypothetical protein